MLFALTPKTILRFSARGGAFCLLAAIILTSTACKSGYPVSAKNSAGAEAREPRPVRIAHVTEMPIERSVTATGTLAALDQATVSAKVPGRVQTIAVDLGSVVRRGQ